MSQFNASAYEIERPTGRCAISGRELVPGEPYIATLVEEGDLLRRLDVSQESWDADQRPADLFSFWRSLVPEPNHKPKMFVNDEVLMNLLERLADAHQPQRLAFRFVLALILMRKKLLRYDKTEARTRKDDSGQVLEEDFWICTPKLDLSRGPMSKWDDSRSFAVMDPHLDDEGIRAVTDQLSEILQAEL